MMKVEFIGEIKDVTLENEGGRESLKFEVVSRSERITCYRPKPSPEIIEKFRPGAKVFVRGSLTVRTYNTKDGRAHYNASCRALETELLD